MKNATPQHQDHDQDKHQDQPPIPDNGWEEYLFKLKRLGYIGALHLKKLDELHQQQLHTAIEEKEQEWKKAYEQQERNYIEALRVERERFVKDLKDMENQLNSYDPDKVDTPMKLGFSTTVMKAKVLIWPLLAKYSP